MQCVAMMLVLFISSTLKKIELLMLRMDLEFEDEKNKIKQGMENITVSKKTKLLEHTIMLYTTLLNAIKDVVN